MKNEFEKFIKTDELKFKYAKGMRDIIGNEIHPYHEIFFYINGNAKFTSESGTEKLTPGTTVIIPKETFHCFTNEGDDRDYIRCVFNFENVSELNYIIEDRMNKIFLTKDKKIAELFIKLKNITDEAMPEQEKIILSKAYFSQILVYLNRNTGNLQNRNISNITEKVIEYIKNNPDKPLAVKTLADKFHISESYLAHIFKKDLHIPIHRYILEIRLTLANKKIKASIPPVQAASECGFRDYSGFYKQYLKMYGMPPSKTLITKKL